MGIEFQFGLMKKFWRWIMVMVVHQYECTSYWIVHFRMVKMVNFMLHFTTIKSFEKWSKSTGGQFRHRQICKGKQDGWDGGSDLWIFPNLHQNVSFSDERLYWSLTTEQQRLLTALLPAAGSEQALGISEVGCAPNKLPMLLLGTDTLRPGVFLILCSPGSSTVSGPKKVFIT